MSFTELYTGAGPLISGSSSDDPAACIFGVPFDSTHSYKPGTRFGPNAIRDAFNNIEVFHPKLGVDLEEIPVHDLGNIQHTVDVKSMLEMAYLEGTLAKELRFAGSIHCITASFKMVLYIMCHTLWHTKDTLRVSTQTAWSSTLDVFYRSKYAMHKSYTS